MQVWWLDRGVTDTSATYSKLVQDVSDTDCWTQNGSLTDVIILVTVNHQF